MTEADWLACDDPEPMLQFLRYPEPQGRSTNRKFRLCLCSWCALYEIQSDANLGRALDVSERYADAMASQQALVAERLRLYRRLPDPGSPTYWVSWAAYSAVGRETRTLCSAFWSLKNEAASESEVSKVARLLRCIFGNPFRPVLLDPSWLTSTVVALAEGIYADRAFDRLPILADALEDAGCGHPDLLAHCRSDGPHARGCWVVDLVLGKE